MHITIELCDFWFVVQTNRVTVIDFFFRWNCIDYFMHIICTLRFKWKTTFSRFSKCSIFFVDFSHLFPTDGWKFIFAWIFFSDSLSSGWKFTFDSSINIMCLMPGSSNNGQFQHFLKRFQMWQKCSTITICKVVVFQIILIFLKSHFSFIVCNKLSHEQTKMIKLNLKRAKQTKTNLFFFTGLCVCVCRWKTVTC